MPTEVRGFRYPGAGKGEVLDTNTSFTSLVIPDAGEMTIIVIFIFF